jgi:hypothetical protein
VVWAVPLILVETSGDHPAMKDQQSTVTEPVRLNLCFAGLSHGCFQVVIMLAVGFVVVNALEMARFYVRHLQNLPEQSRCRIESATQKRDTGLRAAMEPFALASCAIDRCSDNDVLSIGVHYAQCATASNPLCRIALAA